MKRIDVTADIDRALKRYEIAVARFVPGTDSTSLVELPLLAIGQELATALGLPTLRDLVRGNLERRPIQRSQPRPVKAHAAARAGRKTARG